MTSAPLRLMFRSCTEPLLILALSILPHLIKESSVDDICVLFVKMKKIYQPPLGKIGLEALLKCEVLQYVKVHDIPHIAYKIKIHSKHLKRVIDNSREGCFYVDTWKSSISAPKCSPVPVFELSRNSPSLPKDQQLKITAWNCRGLTNSSPFLTKIIENGSEIIIVSEHWLWPFELNRLNEIDPDFISYGHADSRLTSDHEGRGMEGIAILWKNDLDVSIVTGCASDRICCIRVKLRNNEALTIIGVYLPCLDQGLDYYQECVIQLEELIREASQLGGTIVLGDFNAHLGYLGGTKGCDQQPNQQGLILKDHILDNDMFVASLSESAIGPVYTYVSGDVHTTVDYVMLDVCAASMMESCETLQEDVLNTSDHLPQTVILKCAGERNADVETEMNNKIDWEKAEFTGLLVDYQSEIHALVSPLVNNIHGDMISVSEELDYVTNLLIRVADKLSPSIQHRRKKKQAFNDKTLSVLRVKLLGGSGMMLEGPLQAHCMTKEQYTS